MSCKGLVKTRQPFFFSAHLQLKTLSSIKKISFLLLNFIKISINNFQNSEVIDENCTHFWVDIRVSFDGYSADCPSPVW